MGKEREIDLIKLFQEMMEDHLKECRESSRKAEEEAAQWHREIIHNPEGREAARKQVASVVPKVIRLIELRIAVVEEELRAAAERKDYYYPDKALSTNLEVIRLKKLHIANLWEELREA